MTTETMNIHQALVELKTLDKRIESAIKEGEWVVANKHTNTKIGGVDLKEYMEAIKARHQKVTDLISRVEAIKRAVVNSNAVTKVRIGAKARRKVPFYATAIHVFRAGGRRFYS